VTVTREIAVQLEASPSSVRTALDTLVIASPRWKVLAMKPDGLLLKHRPAWYTGQSPTRVDARIAVSDQPGCTLQLKSTSPRLIRADIFGLYERLLQRLAFEVDTELGREAAPRERF
jgi:hypothetical protein